MKFRKSFLVDVILIGGICCWGFSNSILAQCPVDMDGITQLETQADIDAFADAYPNCTSVQGLRIVGTTPDNITSIKNLEQITAIGEGGVVIEGNQQLISLIGLQNIQTIQGDVLIQNNLGLINLQGFENLVSISGNLRLRDITSLESITALANLRSLGGLEILNSSLSNLAGLEGITTIEQDVFFRNNLQLSDFSALQNLTTIAGTLWLWDNPTIRNLEDFNQLTTLNAVSFIRNVQLSDCQLPALCNLVGQTTAQLVIRDNDCGCNNEAEVQASCGGFEGLPICISQDIRVPLGSDFSVDIQPEEVDGGSSDNCALELQLDQTTFDCSDVGDNTVTLLAIDNEGNTTSCTATVTIFEESISCEDAPLILSFPELAYPCEGEVLSVPILVKNFNALTSLQFSLNWDTTLLNFREISNIGPISRSIENDFVLERVTEGILIFGWIEPMLSPVTLVDGEVLFELEMEVLDPQITDLLFSNTPRPIEAGDENFQAEEVDPVNGIINLPDCPILEPLDTLANNGCCPDLENLLNNGDFEQGNSLFNSDYQYETSTQVNAILPGNYGVITRDDALTVCPIWSVDDHTTACDGNGNFLIVNGRTGQNTTTIIWEQQIDALQLDNKYFLCGYLKNLQQCCFDVTPTLYLKVDGQVIDTFQLTQSITNDPCDWQEFNTSFIATSVSQTISLCLDESTLGDGNDLAIDDLSLNEIPPTDFFLSVQDQRPNIPEITASINLMDIADDTLPSPNCEYLWTIAQVDSIDLNAQNIFLNPANMMMGNAADGWGLTTTFPGFIGGTFGEGFYYIALELSNCDCAGDRKEEKVVGWRWNRNVPIANEKDWKLDELSTARLQHFRNQLKTNK